MNNVRKLMKKHHVGFLVLGNFNMLHRVIKEINEDMRIFISSVDDKMCDRIYKELLKDNNDIHIMTDNNVLKTSNITVCNSGVIKEKLSNYIYFDKKDVDFCDILILCDISINHTDNVIITKLWNKMLTHHNEINLPRLLLCSSDPSINLDMPLEINKHNTIKINSGNKIISYEGEFKDEKLMLKTLCHHVKTNHTNNRRCLIFCRNIYQSLYIKMILDSNNVYLVDEEEYNPDKENSIFITYKDYIFIDDIDNIFDCIEDCKINAKQRSQLSSSFCHRMYSEETYQKLPYMIEMVESFIDLDVLSLIDKDIDLNGYSKEIKELRIRGFIDYQGELTEKGVFCRNFDISPYFSEILFEAEQRNFDIFPCIVVSGILNFMDRMMYLTPKTDKVGHFERYFSGKHAKTHLQSYISKFSEYFDRFNFNPTLENLESWCNVNMINLITFKNILEMIKYLKQKYEIINNVEIDIETFDPEIVCEYMDVIFENVFKDKICKVYGNECIDRKLNKYNIFMDHHFNHVAKTPSEIYPLLVKDNKVLFYYPRS